jgi:hypothetical protein
MKTILVFITIVLTTGTLSADIDFPEFSNTSDVKLSNSFKTTHGFSINLPPGWVRIPDDALDDFQKNVARLMPNVSKQTYDYGFQIATSDRWFTYPYILVTVQNKGRVPDSELESLSTVKSAFDKGLRKAQGELKSIVSNMEVNKTYYDSDSHILWTQIRMDVANVGPVRGILAVVVTERGVIQIASNAAAAEFDRYAPLFEQISSEISISEELRYKPRAPDSLPSSSGIDWNRVLHKGMIGAVIGGVCGLFAWIMKKRTPTGPPNA